MARFYERELVMQIVYTGPKDIKILEDIFCDLPPGKARETVFPKNKPVEVSEKWGRYLVSINNSPFVEYDEDAVIEDEKPKAKIKETQKVSAVGVKPLIVKAEKPRRGRPRGT